VQFSNAGFRRAGDVSFSPCFGEAQLVSSGGDNVIKDVWMRDKGDHCECIAVCVDDLLIASKDPDSVVKLLMEKHQFKLKGTGPVEFI